MLSLVLIFGLFSTAPLAHASLDWTYDNPLGWKDVDGSYEICGTGRRQSPIRISSRAATYDSRLANDQLRFASYGRKISGTLSNDGRIVRFTVNGTILREQRPRIWSGGYGRNGYILQSIEFHWGSNSAMPQGSDHIIDGVAAPLEVHFVHYNGRYMSYNEAKGFNDGIAIVAFLFDVTTESNLVTTDYTQIALALPKIAREDQSTSLTLDFAKLMPAYISRGDGAFFRYSGSLTMPPCSEIVSWTVYKQRINILKSTIDYYFNNVMTEIWAEDNRALEPMANTFRPPQPLYGRQVRTNIQQSTASDLAAISRQQARNGTRPFVCFGNFLCMPAASRK